MIRILVGSLLSSKKDENRERNPFLVSLSGSLPSSLFQISQKDLGLCSRVREIRALSLELILARE